jgi:T5SS/PEP-CTERM-associated repeat protein
VGKHGNGNRLVITNGGTVHSSSGELGSLTGTSNEVVVTGAGSSWTSDSASLAVGNVGGSCRLLITNGGAVFQTFVGVILGTVASSANNRVEVDGTLAATNNFGSGALDVRRGAVVLNAGLLNVDQLLLTNSSGTLQWNGGTLSARSSQIGNTSLFRVGNGVNSAAFVLAGNGLHEFVHFVGRAGNLQRHSNRKRNHHGPNCVSVPDGQPAHTRLVNRPDGLQ